MRFLKARGHTWGKCVLLSKSKKTAESTSTLKISTQEVDDDKEVESEQEDETPDKKSVKETIPTKRKRAYQAEQKQKLIEKCIDVRGGFSKILRVRISQFLKIGFLMSQYKCPDSPKLKFQKVIIIRRFFNVFCR